MAKDLKSLKWVICLIKIVNGKKYNGLKLNCNGLPNGYVSLKLLMGRNTMVLTIKWTCNGLW